MANTFLTQERIASMTLGLLHRQIVLPRLVTRMGVAEFRGVKNDTVNVRVPARLTAREYAWRNSRGSDITLDDIEELSVPVSLDTHPYSAVRITDEELTLNIEDFGSQVLQPQVLAVAEKLESILATEMARANYASTIVLDNADNAAWNAIIEARRLLNVENVPDDGRRVIVLGSNVEKEFLTTDLFVKANESGGTSVLDNAILGRKAGFTIVGNCNAISPNKAYAFHPTAFALATAAPAIPDGATFGASQTYEGLAMRWLRDYDAAKLADRSVVSAFCGAASIEDARDDSGDLTGENVRAVEIDFYVNS